MACVSLESYLFKVYLQRNEVWLWIDSSKQINPPTSTLTWTHVSKATCNFMFQTEKWLEAIYLSKESCNCNCVYVYRLCVSNQCRFIIHLYEYIYTPYCFPCIKHRLACHGPSCTIVCGNDGRLKPRPAHSASQLEDKPDAALAACPPTPVFRTACQHAVD